MSAILDALGRALRDLFRLDVLWTVVWPILAASFIWLVLGISFWSTFSGWIAQALDAAGIQTWLAGVEPRWVANALQATLHVLLFVPVVYLTALFLTAIFAAPALVRLVARRDYPALEARRGGGLVGSIVNAVVALAIYVALWLVSIPLWFFGAGFVVPFVAAAYLNQRLFRYDALAEHASRDEMRTLLARHRTAWWSLGLLTGLLQFVPFVNLFAPVLAALAFIHFALGRLQVLRAASPA